MLYIDRLFNTPPRYTGFAVGVFAVGTALELLGPKSLDGVGFIGTSAILGTTAISHARRASPLRPPDVIE